MHNNFLVDRAGKMSKSGGGFTTLQSLVDRGVHPLAYRLLCLSAHYRSELEFSGEAVLAALVRMKRLVMAVAKIVIPGNEKAAIGVGRNFPSQAQPYLDRLDAALSDDLNTPRALVALDELIADKRLPPADCIAALQAFDATLGLDLLACIREELRVRPVGASLTPEEIEAHLDERQQARAARDFARSDAIRDALIAEGVEVMDGDPLRWEWRVSLD
jgi:cysteinyl-tRNA synthetase